MRLLGLSAESAIAQISTAAIPNFCPLLRCRRSDREVLEPLRGLGEEHLEPPMIVGEELGDR